MTPALRDRAASVVAAFAAAGKMLAVAESCTGGLIAATLTTVDGASRVVERGFVTYSNEAKQELLKVPAALIETHGAVSGHVARAMASGALVHSRANVALSVTGIAGPGGGGVEKPVGLVHLVLASRDRLPIARREIFAGDRDEVRNQAVAVAFEMLMQSLDQP